VNIKTVPQKIVAARASFFIGMIPPLVVNTNSCCFGSRY